ncbi:MAG: YHS domain-containing protein [Chloroflexi bacterium]|nr:YHS domain-containing protein [Chloroflexota bacterium]
MDSGQKAEITLEELSRWTGEPVERLRQWRSRGLIGTEGGEGFPQEDVERTRLVQLFLRRGIGLEEIEKAAKGGLLDRFVDIVSLGRAGRTLSLAEAAEILGMDLDLLRRLSAASGFTEQDNTLTEEDVEGMRLAKAALDGGFPEEALLQLVRVYADALGRVAEAEARLFYFHIHDRLRAEGMSGEQLMDATEAAGDRVAPLMEPVILYYHRKGLERAMRENAVMHLAEEAGLTEKAEVPGQMQRAVTFVDLSSFTPLAEAMGDVKAAEVLDRFSTLVREAAGRWDGRVVKQIGDAFMLVYPEPRSAVACSLEIEARTSREPQFPAVRSGVHWGSVLYREGDYVGSNVNIAARVAAEAGRHQVLVTSAVRKEAKGLAEVEFVRLGKRRLKGLADDLELFEARPSGAEKREKAVDPVCGMELGAGEAAATLTLEGEERAFCSDECLRRFVAAPEKYSG